MKINHALGIIILLTNDNSFPNEIVYHVYETRAFKEAVEILLSF